MIHKLLLLLLLVAISNYLQEIIVIGICNA